jgi:hypothetical protein
MRLPVNDVVFSITANVEFTNVKITYVLLGTMLLTNSNKNERQRKKNKPASLRAYSRKSITNQLMKRKLL